MDSLKPEENNGKENGATSEMSVALHSSDNEDNEMSEKHSPLEKDGSSSPKFDAFGMPAYVPRYPLEQRIYESVLSVPWDLRTPEQSSISCTFFDFLRAGKFWRQAEFALRITLFAVLVPSAIIAADVPNSPFVSTTFVLSAGVLASKVTVGEGLSYLLMWIRAGCIWLPIATIGAAIGLGNYIVAWCFFYTIFLFIMAVLTENMVRRICLLLFNNCMIGILVHPERTSVYPSRVMVDWCIGTGLCLFATLVPYPFYSKTEAERTIGRIARNTGAAVVGLASCFWSDSNVKRNMAMTKVRMLTTTIDEELKQFYHEQEHSYYEFLFDSWKVRDVRTLKIQLFERLRTNLRGLSRVLDIVESRPWIVDDSERSRAFGELLTPYIILFAGTLDKLTDSLANAKTYEQIRALHADFIELNDATRRLQREYNEARRVLFYEYKTRALEEFVPLMTFFIFSIVNFRDTMLQLDCDVHKHEYRWRDSISQIFNRALGTPITDNIKFFRLLFTQMRRREIQRVIEAAKVSAAMILTVGFSFLIGTDKRTLSGPNIIAFVSGSNPVEAVQASIVRLTACILGTVLGFFAGTYSTSRVDKVASLCTLMCVGTFFRTDKEYGIMAVYAMFVLIPLDTVDDTTTEDTISRMNQITFGILIYVLISVLVLPLSPSLILRKKRINILIKVSEALTKLCGLFSEPLPIGNMRSTSILRNERGANEDLDELKGSNDFSAMLNRSTRLIIRTDEVMKEIDVLLNDIERRLKGTYMFMGFAHEERGLVAVDYPVKACEGVSLHLHRMVSLLKTMWCSWDVMRSQKYYTPETRQILHTLQPIAWDACRSFCRFVSMLSYLIRNPTVALETDLIEVILEFMQAVEELHLRKNQIMVYVINASIDRFNRARVEPTSLFKEPSNESMIARREKSSLLIKRCNKPHSADSNTFLPLLRKGTNVNIAEEEEKEKEKKKGEDLVVLSDSFTLPVTGEDAEGLHSFTLSLLMFSEESKFLLMNFEEMVEVARDKMH
ncbi:uncharacterized protein TM35_000043170 [Trypanosoma theileri]|uniref:Integral membrane bound transporter domain-containing protein n=1 Tax=Trypanosoma theileri TaxID=67003 RepID=A0A1X0P637_9TRYP|nr:uncharacterized protein TM35_000043170 [Trypanosoma theileri]ORC92103.1 hypothetical protein TM35_000043170 [Trypanosoma theileri]